MVKLSNESILVELQNNSNVSFIDLAEKFRVSDTAVRKRVRKLKENGVIKKFTIEIDHRKLGYELTAFIGFDAEAEAFISIIEEIRDLEHVRSIFQTSLDHDFLLECWFRDNDDLTTFIRKLEKIKGVTRVCPATVIQRIK